ncbi:MAG: hypothetical protein WCK93_12890 [Nitrosomonadales bacterium]
MSLQGFNEAAYLVVKLADLKSKSSAWEGKTTADLTTALTKAGFTAEQHYMTYGYKESLAPNQYFNAAEYSRAKATALYNDGLLTNKYASVDAAEATFKAAWTGDMYQHYLQFGSSEGINPSNAFDESSYYASKLASLQASDATKTAWAGKTVVDLQAYFKAAGLTALGHYEQFGVAEKIAVTVVPASEIVSVTNPGQTFTLTTGADNIVGTTGNDTINGLSATTIATATDTLTVVDVINGGAGTDTLNITVTGVNTDVTDGALISNVEYISIRNTAATTTGLASVSATGLEGVNATGVGDITVTNLATGKAFSANGATGSPVISQGYVAAATSAVTNLGGATLGTLTLVGAGITSATINTTGAVASTTGAVNLVAAKTITINATSDLTVASIATTGATATLTVTGAGKVDTGTALDADITVVNASANTGGVSVILGNTLSTKFTGGSGNDTVTLNGVQTGAVDGGAGTGDRVIVSNTTDIGATPAALVTNFEVLRNTAGGATLDVSTVAGITSIELGATGQGATKLTVAQALAVTNIANDDTLTLALATATGTSDVLTVTLKNSTATTSADLTTATVTGFETLNVVSSSGSSADISVVSFAAAGDLTALNLSGAFPISVNTANITKAAAINASGVTYAGSTATDYALTITGALVKGSAVTGSAAADSITATVAIAGTTGDFVTYNAGAGNDAISATAAALNNIAGANGSVKIEGGLGTDTLTFTDAGSLTLADGNFQFVTGVETISYTVANKAITIAGAGFFNSNFAATGATLTLGDATNAQINSVDLTPFSGAATVSLTATAATTVAQTISTGSGADTVTLLMAGTTTGTGVVNTGAGNDTIKITVGGLTTGSITINAGAGQDTITITGDALTAAAAANQVYTVNAGHSTLAAADSITGAKLSDGTDQGTKIDFDGAAAANANVAASSVTGYTAGELTYTVTNGLLAFAGTSAAALTAATKATLAQTVITTVDKAVAYTQTNADATVDSYVFEVNAGGNSLVKLVGVTLLGIDAITAGYIDIA